MPDADQLDSHLPRWLVVGFSGHRHLKDKLQATDAAIRLKLKELFDSHMRIAGVCSAASGADTLFAEEILRRGAPLSVILPFAVSRFELDFQKEPEGSWPRSLAIIQAVPLNRIDVVHQIEADLSTETTTENENTDVQKRDALAYHEATVRTVDRADVLLAVWNEKPGEGAGGTSDAVAYAIARGIPVVIYNPEIGAFTRDESKTLAEGTARRDLDTSPRTANESTGGCVALNPKKAVKDQLDSFDAVANVHRPPSQSLMQLAVTLHLVAAAVAAFAILFVTNSHLAFAPALFEVVVLAGTYYLLAMKSQHHHLWFTSRVRAEICRTFLATWDVRRHPSLIHQPRHAIADHLEHERQARLPSWLKWLIAKIPFKHVVINTNEPEGPEHLFRTLRFLRDLDATQVPELNIVRDNYVSQRLVGEFGQIPYFTRKLGEARCTYRAYTLGGTVASGAAILSAIAVLVVLPFEGHEILKHSFEYLGIVMPLFATAFTFLMVSSDATRRVHRYQQMIDILYKVLPKVKAAPTWDALSRAVTQVEEELLQEIVEWQSFVHYTEHLH